MPNKYLYLLLFFLFFIVQAKSLTGQDNTQTESSSQTDKTPVPENVDIKPTAEDSEIEERLSGILEATGWFSETGVKVNKGVVFLSGKTDIDEQKRWAGELAQNTQDVAAVVNQITVTEPDIWNYEPAFTGVQELWRNIMHSIPFLVFSLIVLILFWGISAVVAKITRASLKKREMNILLQDIAARSLAVIVFLMGLYIVFHIADLTGVALTVLGGTGLLGIILGIAFRNITENFLASIFLSLQNPFHAGDLVEIDGQTGFIQRLTIRATLLMTLDGNHMQIPNSTVYKSSILNFSSNPNQRTIFDIGISYEDSITLAQGIGANILKNHPAVLEEPEPWILVDKLTAVTINLRFYFWIDGRKHNLLKVKSSVMRQVKSAYQNEGISMPAEEREIIFPKGVPVQLYKQESPVSTESKPEPAVDQLNDSKVATDSEGELQSNDEEIREQARKSRSPEEGENLLRSDK